ncbi:hypothetical protein D3C77_257720 [compost metagenome]
MPIEIGRDLGLDDPGRAFAIDQTRVVHVAHIGREPADSDRPLAPGQRGRPFPLRLAIPTRKFATARDADAGVDQARLPRLHQGRDVWRRRTIEANEVGRVQGQVEGTEPVRALAPVHAEVEAADILRLQVDVLILHIDDRPDGFEGRISHGGDVFRRQRRPDHVGVARALHAHDIVEDQGVALAKQADDALLLHGPVVGGEGEIAPAFRRETRLEDKARAPGFGFLRLQVRVARPLRRGDDRSRAAAEGCDASGLEICLAQHPIRTGVAARDQAGVDLLQVRRPEPLGPGAPQPNTVHHVPSRCDLGFGHTAEVAVLLKSPGKLHLQATHQGHAHFRRHERRGELHEGRLHRTRAPGVGRRTDPEQIGFLELSCHSVREVDRAVHAGVAVIQLGLAPELNAGRHADITRRKRKHVRSRHLEVPKRQGRTSAPHRVHADGVDRRLGARGSIAARGGVHRIAAVEGIIGVWRRQTEVLLQQGRADGVLLIRHLGFGIDKRRIPIEAEGLALEASQRPHLARFDIDNSATHVDEPIVGQGDGQAFSRNIEVRQPVGVELSIGEGHRPKGVPVV